MNTEDINIKCYFEGCEKQAYKDSYWCTRTHQIAWQKENYGEDGEKRGPKSVEQIQKQIERIKQNLKAKDGKLI